MADPTETDKKAAQARLSARKQMLDQGVAMLKLGRTAGVGAITAGLRTMLPMLEVYAGSEAIARIIETDDAEDRQETEDGQKAAERQKTGAFGLNRRQLATLQAAGTKALLETIEITSITHPVYKGATAFRARSDSGEAQAPHLSHLLSLVAFGRDYFGFDQDEVPEVPKDPPAADNRAVLYVATAPGEYAVVRGPQTPTMIRRAAMRQRSYDTPQLAILSNNTQPIAQPIMQSAAQPMMLRSAAVAYEPQRMTAGAQVVPLSQVRGGNFARSPATAQAPVKARAKGCGCGGSGGGGDCGCGHGRGCGCGCGGHHSPAASPARYDDDGSCASITDISCDTRWRVRECIKVALCDMLRCVADEVCEDGRFAPKPDLGACLEGFVCSLLHCLPDAICPPPVSDPCCLPQPHTDCTCNFAVGD